LQRSNLILPAIGLSLAGAIQPASAQDTDDALTRCAAWSTDPHALPATTASRKPPPQLPPARRPLPARAALPARPPPQVPGMQQTSRAAEADAGPPAAAAAGATAAAATMVAPDTQPLSDDVAKDVVDPSKSRKPEYEARVERCEFNDYEERITFYMENGQIWRQSNADRVFLRDKSCQFDIRLKEGMFGWVMHIPSENRRIRVRRVR
jgi:hypothetical protein